MKLIAATKNKGKMKELRAILEGVSFRGEPVELLSMDEAGVTLDVEEDADTFSGNALKKAREIMALCGEATLADDSGLCVDALCGAPGVYSARYAGEGATDHANNEKLLRELEGEANRGGKFVCAIALALPDGEEHVFHGELAGELAHERKGSGGFGYDCLFYLPEYGRTTAELSPEEKNSISHRARALEGLRRFLTGGA